MNTNQGEEMLRKATAAKVKHMVYFTNRWIPLHRYFGSLVTSGFIDRLFPFHFKILTGRNLDKATPYKWRADAKRSNGVLSDLGSHTIDLCRHWIGEIRSVNASLAAHAPNPHLQQTSEPANDSAILTVETDTGVHGVIHASPVASVSGMSQYFSIQGETGILELNYSHVTGGWLGFTGTERSVFPGREKVGDPTIRM